MIEVPAAAFPGIYAITDHNGNRYIGSATDVGRRWQSHLSDLRAGRHHSYKLQDAWNTLGEDRFTLSVLEAVEDFADLLLAEQRWLDESEPYYNVRRSASRPGSGPAWREKLLRYKIDRQLAEFNHFVARLAACERLGDALKLLASKNPKLTKASETYQTLYQSVLRCRWPWDNPADDLIYSREPLIIEFSELDWFDGLYSEKMDEVRALDDPASDILSASDHDIYDRVRVKSKIYNLGTMFISQSA